LAADGKPINHEGTASSTEYLNNSNYRKGFFIDSYFPKAPRIAAPDTSRQCAAPGQCSISKVNSFSVDDASEGQVIYFGSQVQSTLRFYAWASDDQAPLTDIWVDWGDGTVQKVTDGRIKNHKPFCGVAKQCENIPGLSCSSDADCPANAGKCVETGSCSADPGRSCFKDSQCGTTGGNCVKRLTARMTVSRTTSNLVTHTIVRRPINLRPHVLRRAARPINSLVTQRQEITQRCVGSCQRYS
jgi:hypothetical protein